MKLKSLIAFAGVACAAASYGDATTVSTANTLCRIKFTTSEKEVLIGLPLVDVGGTTQTINATNYILAANLTNGDALLGKDQNGKWCSWVVKNNAWVNEATVGDNNTQYNAGSDASFTRGGAVRLSFKVSGVSHTVYLYGQAATTAGGAIVTASRSTSAATYTLLSNINASAVGIQTLKPSGIQADDKIVVLSSGGTGKEYKYNGSKWMETSTTTQDGSSLFPGIPDINIGGAGSTTESSKEFAAGEGFFYVTKKGTGDVTFAWGN